jgi:NhaP-type Na+/H+ or K+/H+ antiporter
MSFKSWQAHIFAFLFLVLLFLLRFLWCRFALRDSAYSSRDRWISSLLVPKGLAAAVLASIPAQKGIAGGEWIESLTYAIVLQSIVISSTLIMLSGTLERRNQEGFSVKH